MITSWTSANAQSLQEVVYLKNGSVIKGVVIEQVPGVSLKIRTNDGSVFAYSMSEVEKISKEELTQIRVKTTSRTNSSLDLGYRGFVDLGFTVGVGGGRGCDRIELATSHGVQIIPQLYVGAGVGVSYFYDFSDVAIPLFVDVRTDLLQNKTTPFIDLKIGYSVAGISGFYLSPTLGCRFNRFSIGLSYIMQKQNVYGWSVGNVGGFSIKLGLEF